MGTRYKVWVSSVADGITNRHPVNVGCPFFRHTKTKATMHLRNIKGKNGQEKTTKTYSTAILKALLCKDDRGHRWWTFPEERKDCQKGTRSTNHLLYIGKHSFKEDKMKLNMQQEHKLTRRRPLICSNKCENLKRLKLADRIINFMTNTMEN